jgi:hypothetical protein
VPSPQTFGPANFGTSRASSNSLSRPYRLRAFAAFLAALALPDALPASLAAALRSSSVIVSSLRFPPLRPIFERYFVMAVFLTMNSL